MVQWILMALISLLTRRFGCSLHLPAHRRGAGLPDELRALLRKRAGVWDLPELPEIGGPLESDGAVAESQRQAAALMGVAMTVHDHFVLESSANSPWSCGSGAEAA